MSNADFPQANEKKASVGNTDCTSSTVAAIRNGSKRIQSSRPIDESFLMLSSLPSASGRPVAGSRGKAPETQVHPYGKREPDPLTQRRTSWADILSWGLQQSPTLSDMDKNTWDSSPYPRSTGQYGFDSTVHWNEASVFSSTVGSTLDQSSLPPGHHHSLGASAIESRLLEVIHRLSTSYLLRRL